MFRSDAPSVRPAPPSPDAPDALDALKPGARLGEFIVERVLGIGGFGIVYLAVDQVLLRQVAVKEYLPTVLAGRGADGRVTLRAPAHRDTFQAGLRSFLNEAQLLARFDHPSLVKVHRFWEAHGTAYMAMPYYEGQVAGHRQFVQQGPVDEARLRAFLDPLLDALAQLHRADVYHRDISPDNILLLPEGRPVLLDFGAARHVIADRTQTLTAMLKPSFAPVEQYGDVPGMRQGPWTDLYALGAVVHHLLTGDMPPPAAVRAVRDAMPVLSAMPRGEGRGVSRTTLAAIDWMLSVVPEQRPQSVAELRDALDGIVVPPPPTPRVTAAAPSPVPVTGAWHATVPVPAPPRPPSRSWRRGGAAAAAFAVLLAVGAGWWSRAPADATTAAAAVAAPAPQAAVSLPASAAAPARPAPNRPAPHVPAAAATARPAEPAPRRAASPSEVCAGRNAFSRAVCETRTCLQPKYRQHAECTRARDAHDRRDGYQ